MHTDQSHPSTNPASYWRASKQWSQLLGKEGKIVLATVIETPPPHLTSVAPYSYGIVEVDGLRQECMGLPGEVLLPGDSVKFVLRRAAEPNAKGIIAYGLKVAKI